MEHILQISSAALRGYHNTLIPVNRIPPEVMAMIFANMQQRLPSFVPIPETGEYGDQHRSWLAVVHVCRHWRGIAATFPVLWSSIDSHIIPRTFLRRSKSVPLSLYLDVRHPQPGITPGLIKSLARQSHRIEQFHINTIHYDDDTPIFSLLKRPAPHLVSLTIATDGREGDALPPIFAGIMPKLKHLTLECFTSWPQGYFRNLTHLFLYHQLKTLRPSTSVFLDYLECSPHLEELALIGAGPTRDDTHDFPLVPKERLVSLSRLRELVFGDFFEEIIAVRPVARLLSHLLRPRTSKLLVWASGTSILADSEDFGSFLPHATSCVDGIESIREWRLLRRPPGSNYIDSTSTVSASVTISGGTLFVYGKFTPRQIIPIPRLLPHISKLVVRDEAFGAERLSITFWQNIFRDLHNLTDLKYISLYNPNKASSVLAALHEQNPSAGSGSSARRVFCPNLATFSIIDDKPNLLPLSLLSFARARALHGVPLTTLEVINYHLAPWPALPKAPDIAQEHNAFKSEDVEELKKYIEKVIVDDEIRDEFVWIPAEDAYKFSRWIRHILKYPPLADD